MQYESTDKQTILGTWRIQLLGDQATWLLQWKPAGGEWRWMHGYSSPEAAAGAVANGETGISEWDQLRFQKDLFSLHNWRSF